MLYVDINQLLADAAKLLPREMNTRNARVLLHAIGLQESGLLMRYQIVQGRPGDKGPARGLWQFEVNGVAGVMRHKASRTWLRRACDELHTPFEAAKIWTRIEHDDWLAAALARLLLFTDPKPLPEPSDAEACWQYYQRNWRPGKPRRETWTHFLEVANGSTL